MECRGDAHGDVPRDPCVSLEAPHNRPPQARRTWSPRSIPQSRAPWAEETSTRAYERQAGCVGCVRAQPCQPRMTRFEAGAMASPVVSNARRAEEYRKLTF